MDKLKTLLQIFKFLKTRKKYWLLPIIIIFVLIGFLLVISEGSVIAPFIYTLF